MQPQLNHMIIPARDRLESARFLSEILGLAEPVTVGPFEQVTTGNGVSLDFADVSGFDVGLKYADTPGHVQRMHLAFEVSEREFDEVFARIRERNISYWADPWRRKPGETNETHGRGVYFEDPNGHTWEILTEP